MSGSSGSAARASNARALLIVAAGTAAAGDAITCLRERFPKVHITAIVREGTSVPADCCLGVRTEGPYGFALRPALLRRLRGRYDCAWAVVDDLGSPAYRRVATLLKLARAREKRAVGADGASLTLDEWVRRAGISAGLRGMARAGLRRLLAPYARARARRLLHGPKPPWGLKRVNIGVSDRCNQRCIMCSEHSPYCADGGRRMAAEGVLDERDFGLLDAASYSRLIGDLVDLGTREVELCGLGEPMLHPKCFDFLREAKEAGLWVRLVTNASLLDEQEAEELVRLGLDELHVSLNAATPETYAKVHGTSPETFSRVLTAVRAATRARTETGARRPLVEVSFVVQADNYREPMEWVELAAQTGADIVTFSALGAAPPTAPVQLIPEQMAEAKANVAGALSRAHELGLEIRGTFGALADSGTSFSADLYAHMPCYIGYIFALVTADGRIHPCCACERVVGNLADGGFGDAWRGETYRQFREECLDLPNRLPGLDGCSCMSCPYGPWNVEFHERLYGR